MAYLGRSPSQGVRNRYYFTASGGETSVSGALTGGTLTFTDGNYVDVNLNGVTLVAGTDYNTSTANTIAGLSALTASDVVEIVVYDVFSVFSGNVNSDFSVGGNLSVTGTTAFTGASTLTAGFTATDGCTITTADNDPQLTLVSTDADANSGPQLDFYRNSASPADNDILGALLYTGKSSTGSDKTYSSMNGFISNVANANASGGIIFNTRNSDILAERLRITSAGLVGIGSSSPDALLQIEKSDSGTTIDKEPSSQSGPNIAIHNSNQTANNLSSVQFTNRGTNGVAETATAGIHVKHEAQGGTYSYGSMNFNTTNSAGSYATRMHIASGGNVGIGTASPSGLLNCHNASGDANMFITTGTTTSSTTILFGDSGSTDRGRVQYDHNGDSMRFHAAGSERARITQDGDVLVGQSSQSFSGNGRVSVLGAVGAYATSIGAPSTSGAYYYIDFRTSGGTQTGAILSPNGTSTSYNTSSDYRLKENVTAITNATDRLKQLNPVRFNFIADADTTVDGFLAHEAQAVVPESVTGTKDAMRDEQYEVSAATGDIYTPATDDTDEVIHSSNVEQPEELADGQQWRETTPAEMGTRTVPDYQGIDQSKLVPLLVATIQELEARIAALETA